MPEIVDKTPHLPSQNSSPRSLSRPTYAKLLLRKHAPSNFTLTCAHRLFVSGIHRGCTGRRRRIRHRGSRYIRFTHCPEFVICQEKRLTSRRIQHSWESQKHLPNGSWSTTTCAGAQHSSLSMSPAERRATSSTCFKPPPLRARKRSKTEP